MKGLMFQKSQKITEIETKNQRLQEQLKTVLLQFNQVQSELNSLIQQHNKDQSQIEIFQVDKQLLEHQLKAQGKQQQKLRKEIGQIQLIFKKVQQTSLTKQQQLYQLTRNDEQLSQRVCRLKQQFKMYLTIGQSQSNIVNLAQKLQKQKKTSEKMLEILLNKQKARIKYFNLLTAKRQNDQLEDHKKGANKQLAKQKDPFKMQLSPKRLQLSKSDFGLIRKNVVLKQQTNTQNDDHKDKLKKYYEMIRKKNMILNKK